MFEGKRIIYPDRGQKVSVFALSRANEVNSNFVQTLSKLRLNGNLQNPSCFFSTRLRTNHIYDILVSPKSDNPGESLSNGMIAIKEFEEDIDVFGGQLDVTFWLQSEIYDRYPKVESIIKFNASTRPKNKFRMTNDGRIISLIPKGRYLNVLRFDMIEDQFWAYEAQDGIIIGFNNKYNPTEIFNIINDYWII